ncbi:MAG: flagellar basal-body rod protein FlgG [Shewanellaceae bacterium]|jgi:flagellar basal-body rod protein FlgG|nr:flagellar basal-body rod protein FlgG [Shewanellaceae bacterium]
MHPGLWIGKTGLESQQTEVAVISNNIANASTVGYKKGRAVFEDLMYQTINQPGGVSSQNTSLPNGLMLGAGSKVTATQKSFSQGKMITTKEVFDVMIDGHGFFKVQLPNGDTAYTRSGQFTKDSTGQLVMPGNGFLVLPGITVPEDATSVTISPQGAISVKIAGQAAEQEIGLFEIADFINPSGLQPIGGNMYVETSASGNPIEGTAALDGFGSIRQGSLETSNVNVAEELVNLIQSQRVYEMNAKVIAAVDQMLSFVNQTI